MGVNALPISGTFRSLGDRLRCSGLISLTVVKLRVPQIDVLYVSAHIRVGTQGSPVAQVLGANQDDFAYVELFYLISLKRDLNQGWYDKIFQTYNVEN